MGFFTSNRSSQHVTKAFPRIKISARKDQKESLDLLARNRSDALFCESEYEDIDIVKQLELAGGMSDESDCMWLSSDFNSLSLLDSDGSGSVWELNSSNISYNNKLPPWMLSSCGSSASSISDGARISPLDDQPIDINGELLKEDCSPKNPLVCCSVSSGSSCDRSLQEGSLGYGSSCTSLNSLNDSACGSWESDRTGIWIALLDLNLENSEFVKQKDDKVGISFSDFSSPYHTSKENPQSEFSFSSSSSANSIYLTEASWSLSREFEYDEPLFWPYHENLYKILEFDKISICVSPRKNGRMAGNTGINELKSVEIKLSSNSLPASRKIMQQKRVRRPEYSQASKKSATVFKTRGVTCKNIQNSAFSHTQLIKSSSQVSYKLSSCNSSMKEKESSIKKETHQLKSKNQIHKQEDLLKRSLLEFEASHFHLSLVEGVTIEKLIGLDEFDGHEGLNVDFNDEFLFSL